MKRPTPRKCAHCRKFYLPDPRRAHDQRYCDEPACRRASKKAAQKKWLSSPKGRDYFKGAEHVERVRVWRKKRRGQPPESDVVLQDLMISEAVDHQRDTDGSVVLQDLRLERDPLFIGLMAQVTGLLQDEIEPALQRLHSRGQMILGEGPGMVNQN